MQKEFIGKTVTVSNGHLSYEIADAKPEFVFVLIQLLEIQLGYCTVSTPVLGLSEVVAEIELNDVRLGIGWDNWSGAYIMAYCAQGDLQIEKIASYLSIGL